MIRKVASFNAFAYACPYSSADCSVNNGYGCTHPEQEETDFDDELGKDHGKCYCYSCPLGIEPDEEDFENPDVDWDGIAREDCTVESEFAVQGEYIMVNTGMDASEDEKRALRNYERWINRYNPDWKETPNE